MKYNWSKMSSRERDALVAEKVMRCKISKRKDSKGEFITYDGHGKPVSYTSDIKAAWEVVEKLTSIKTPYFMLVICNAYLEKTAWQAEFDLDRPYNRVIARSYSAPEAICLAALKAVGVDIE